MNYKKINEKLIESCKNGQLQLVKDFVFVGAEVSDNDYCAIRTAYKNGYKEISKYLLNFASDRAYDMGYYDVVMYLMFLERDIRKK